MNTPPGFVEPSLNHIQVSWLHNAGKEVVVVTSGAVAIGKLRVKQEQLLSRSVRHTLLNSAGKMGVADDLEPRACAAAGQAGLMSLYETMFNQYGVGCAQVTLSLSLSLSPPLPPKQRSTLQLLL